MATAAAAAGEEAVDTATVVATAALAEAAAPAAWAEVAGGVAPRRTQRCDPRSGRRLPNAASAPASCIAPGRFCKSRAEGRDSAARSNAGWAVRVVAACEALVAAAAAQETC